MPGIRIAVCASIPKISRYDNDSLRGAPDTTTMDPVYPLQIKHVGDEEDRRESADSHIIFYAIYTQKYYRCF